MKESLLKPRIEIIDALRGFALMGVFMVHMVEYFELYWYNREPGFIHDSVFFLFAGKSYPIFAMLFGLSFYIIMDRNKARGIDFRGRFLWRLVLLMGFGYLNGLIYSGDILQVLALVGLGVVLVYPLKNKAVLAVALIFIFQVPALIYFIISLVRPELVPQQPVFWTIMGSNLEIYANGSFNDVFTRNTWMGQLGKWAFLLESGRIWILIGLSILGVWLGRINFFSVLSQKRKFLLRGLLFSGILALILDVVINSTSPIIPEGASSRIFSDTAGNYLSLAIASTWVFGFLLLYPMDFPRSILEKFATCGRMSLTLYIMQGMIFVPFFYNFGLGYYANIGQLRALIMATVAWILQMGFCHIWFKYFNYGPFEWFWRSATYLRKDIPLKLSYKPMKND